MDKTPLIDKIDMDNTIDKTEMPTVIATVVEPTIEEQLKQYVVKNNEIVTTCDNIKHQWRKTCSDHRLTLCKKDVLLAEITRLFKIEMLDFLKSKINLCNKYAITNNRSVVRDRYVYYYENENGVITKCNCIKRRIADIAKDKLNKHKVTCTHRCAVDKFFGISCSECTKHNKIVEDTYEDIVRNITYNWLNNDYFIESHEIAQTCSDTIKELNLTNIIDVGCVIKNTNTLDAIITFHWTFKAL